MEYDEENMETNIYPQVPPTAPPENVCANSHSYRLQKIIEIQAYLRLGQNQRQAL